MKLKFKVISIIGALFLVVGFLFVFSDIKKPEDGSDTLLNDQQDKKTTLFWSEADFNEIHLNNESGEDDIILVKNEQGNWDTAKPLAEEINLNKLDQAVSIIFSLSGHSKEAKLSSDEAFYEEDERSITLLNQTGIKEKLTIGKKNEEGTFYYVKLLESDEIFQVASQLIDALPAGYEDLFNRSVVRITSEQVRKITIYNDIETIELAPVSPFSEEEIRENISGWYMHRPYNNIYPVKYNPMSEMIYGIKDIEWLEVVDESARNLEQYGLTDVNFKITFSSEDEEETILIGSPATNQSYYAKLATDDKVFTVDSGALYPYRLHAFDLVERFVKVIALDVLKQLDIQTAARNYVITVDQIDDRDESESTMVFKINDQEVEDEVFRELYGSIGGLSVNQEVTNATYTTPEVTMSYIIMDADVGEREIVVDFVHYDEENYAVFLDRKADFLVKKDEIIQIIEDINEHSE